jgi:ABC-2 type transport system ATP-binding protein
VRGDAEIRGLVKRFGAVTAVDGLDLELGEGRMTGLIGPDGAGKTTTLRLLCGLLRPDAGACRVAGLDVPSHLGRVRGMIGYMPQRFSLYPDLTVEENLRFFADLFQVDKSEREKRLGRLLAFSRLGPFSRRRASDLSGGMKQKLALSCALVHTPRLLFLDEPTTGVDPLSRREFWEILSDLRSQGVTLLVSTPYMDEAARCDRVALMHKGRLLHEAAPSEIPGLFRGALVEVEFRRGGESPGAPAPAPAPAASASARSRAAGPRPVEPAPGHSVQARAAEALRADGRFRSVQPYGDRIHVSGPGAARDLAAGVRASLDAAGLPAAAVRPARPGIEDVFVELMGG